jgi:methylthioribose-1-phosphate isomerase
MPVETVVWEGGRMRIVDQTLLPGEFKYVFCDTVEEVWEAIKNLRVRGAPAIGIAAALGVLVGTRGASYETAEELESKVLEVADYLATSRPTAVNLFWALDRMKGVVAAKKDKPPRVVMDLLEAEAVSILEEDKATCRAIGKFGAELVKDGDGILTHCNAGGLATADYGTALAVIFAAHEQGKRVRVYADETRPLLQGARLTTWELMHAGIDVTLICDNMAAVVMREGKVHLVVVGADRIAGNGDTANKIGTYGVALLARAHSVPFYVAAPLSTFDLSLSSGDEIPIEERAPEEVTQGFGKRTAPEGVKVYCPAFDVTPADLVTAFITEKGVIRPPYTESIGKLASGS